MNKAVQKSGRTEWSDKYVADNSRFNSVGELVENFERIGPYEEDTLDLLYDVVRTYGQNDTNEPSAKMKQNEINAEKAREAAENRDIEGLEDIKEALV